MQWREPRTAGALADSTHAILQQWNAAGVPYCALRGEDGDKDIDLLVAESWVPWCRGWLEDRGFVPGPGGSPFKLVMLRYAGGRACCLDLHWKAVQYGIVYMDERRMLERRTVAAGVSRLSPEDELLHLVLHNVLRTGPLRPAALQRIRALLDARLDWDYLRAHLDAFRLRSAVEAVIAWVRTAPLAPGEEPRGLRRRVRRAALAARPGNLPRRAGVWMRRRWLPRRSGGLVALIGPDGAGKSTVVRAVVTRARAIPTLKIDTTYLGPWGQMRLSLVPALRRAGITPTVRPADVPELVTRNRAVPPARVPGATSVRARLASQVKGSVFYGAIFVELMYRYITSVFFNVRRGHWVVSDRYITDLRYLYKERPIRNHASIRRLLCRLFPKPDLLIVLDNRADVVATRKSGLTGSQIEVLRHFNLEAARNYRHEVLTTDRSPDELADVVLQRMLVMRAGL